MFYFDHSATTPLHPKVKTLMVETAEQHYGNPSSVHSAGRKARVLIENARNQMAKAVGCQSHEIIFTGGGTEGNNLVIWNLLRSKKKHVITSAIEHPAILKVLDSLKDFGITYTALPVDKFGIVNTEGFKSAIQDDTGLTTIMIANNEMGSIQPIADIASIVKSKGILMHTDAVQALGKIPVHAENLGVDLMSFSAHKFYGPKGVGALFIRDSVELRPLIIGGSQERSLRAGTENTIGIAALGLAAELATDRLSEKTNHLQNLAKYFKKQLIEFYPDAIFHGHTEHHLPGLVSVAFPGFRSNLLLSYLDRENIAVSSGAACSSGDIKPSRILEAMGVEDDINTCTLRLSFGNDNTLEEINILVKVLKSTLEQIRSAA